MEVSVIVPSKNESANIANCINRLLATCPQAEIWVMDSGSDNTKAIVDALRISNVQCRITSPDRGKGDAIAQGIKLCTKDIIIQLDADLQFFPEDIPQLIQPLLNNTADMTLGSRFMQTSHNSTQWSLRHLGNLIISAWVSILFGQKISDALAGFKAWRKEVSQSFELKHFDFSYEVELFARALQKKWRVQDVAVNYTDRVTGTSKVSVVKVGLKIIFASLCLRFKKYG